MISIVLIGSMHVPWNIVATIVQHDIIFTFTAKPHFAVYIGAEGTIFDSRQSRSFKAIHGATKAYALILFLLKFVV